MNITTFYGLIIGHFIIMSIDLSYNTNYIYHNNHFYKYIINFEKYCHIYKKMAMLLLLSIISYLLKFNKLYHLLMYISLIININTKFYLAQYLIQLNNLRKFLFIMLFALRIDNSFHIDDDINKVIMEFVLMAVDIIYHN